MKCSLFYHILKMGVINLMCNFLTFVFLLICVFVWLCSCLLFKGVRPFVL